jgi:TfoX/Sxy family transcriptional regulator of competence genes
MTSPEDRFAAITAPLLREPEITQGTGFGSRPGLRVEGKIFAMLVDDEMVVKLPADRCAQLVAAGGARPFDRGQGRPMREWICVADADEWPELAREALGFVGRRRAG